MDLSQKEKDAKERKKAYDKAYNKAYYEANRNRLNAKKKSYLKVYREVNIDKTREKARIYREANKDNTKSYYKTYAKANTDKIKKYERAYRESNKDKINIRIKSRYKNDNLYKLKKQIRVLVKRGFKLNGFAKKSKTADIIGCSFEEFKLYIESKFEPWMNWNNRGNWNGMPIEINTSWDIDHIIPLVTANIEEDIIKLNHYTNLQPLCSYTNRWIKRTKANF